MDQDQAVHTLRRIIEDSDNIVFFGGAGVSTESNIPDFRSASGLYRQQKSTAHRPEDMLHSDFFYKNTELFYQYYFSHMVYPDAKPNAAHHALAALEQDKRLRAVITQNVDGLHQMAGSKQVIELHGSIHRNFCIGCGAAYPLSDIWRTQPAVPRCTVCGEIVKPDVVLYGEALKEDAVNKAVDYIRHAQVLLVGGTSLSVYPAAGMIRYFSGDALVLINNDETPYDHLATLVIRDKIGIILRRLIK